jgi:hypothetical protein
MTGAGHEARLWLALVPQTRKLSPLAELQAPVLVVHCDILNVTHLHSTAQHSTAQNRMMECHICTSAGTDTHNRESVGDAYDAKTGARHWTEGLQCLQSHKKP